MAKPPSLNDIQFASRMSESRARSALDFAERLRTDPDQARRLSIHECPPCFYQRNVAGMAFRDYTCQICERENSHPNTNVPKLCQACATHNNLCTRCLADLGGTEAAQGRTEAPTASE